MIRFMAAILLCVTLPTLLCVAPPTQASDIVQATNHDRSLSSNQVQALVGQVEREYEKLKAIFAVDVGPVTLSVRKTGVARHLPPAEIIIPSRLIKQARAITAHELTHLLTQGWASGLLKEGLAVYAQDKFGEQPGWPNDAKPIHRVAAEAIGVAQPLVRGPGDANRVLTTRNPGKAALRRAAYSVAGSWVTWIIDERMGGDIARFMATLYRSGNYKRALGSSFKELLPLWRAYVKVIR
ncbi:MAG: hypothetical protein HOH04_11625 [Rhodospirillaceae bacterium]|jgi:hypothetical protein|nr:hypothetical protein [Rhodospirillaceae bacterium]